MRRCYRRTEESRVDKANSIPAVLQSWGLARSATEAGMNAPVILSEAKIFPERRGVAAIDGEKLKSAPNSVRPSPGGAIER